MTLSELQLELTYENSSDDFYGFHQYYCDRSATDSKLPWFVQIATGITKYDDNYNFRQVLQSVMIIKNCTPPNSPTDCLIFSYVTLRYVTLRFVPTFFLPISETVAQ